MSHGQCLFSLWGERGEVSGFPGLFDNYAPLDYDNGQAEIVDGNHTYMAMAVAAAKAQEMGLMIPAKVPAYCIKRVDWMKFLVPLRAARIIPLRDPVSGQKQNL